MQSIDFTTLEQHRSAFSISQIVIAFSAELRDCRFVFGTQNQIKDMHSPNNKIRDYFSPIDMQHQDQKRK